MSTPNDGTIAQMAGAFNCLKAAAAPLDPGDPLREDIESAGARVESIIDELKRLRDNL